MFLDFGICFTFILTLLSKWPQILDIVLHVNESQLQIQTIIVTEYFLDKEKYSYLILLHTNAVLCIGSTTLTATSTMIIGWIIYVCGIFKVAR